LLKAVFSYWLLAILLAASFPANASAVPAEPTDVVAPRAAEPASTPAVRVRLSCGGNPERTYVTNNSASPVVIHSLASQYLKSNYEPLAVARRVEPGKTVEFQTGAGARSNVLARNFIYDRDATSGYTEGASLSTSAGTFGAWCAFLPGYFPVHPPSYSGDGSALAGLLPSVLRTTHFVAHYRPRSFAAANVVAFRTDAEAAVGHIATTLDVEYTGVDDYYLSYSTFPQPDPGLRGFTSYRTPRMYQLYDGSGSRLERQYMVAHEMTHRIANRTVGGGATIFLDEGLAMYLGQRYLIADGDVSLDGFSRAALNEGTLVSIQDLSSGRVRFMGRLLRRYPYDEAGSFVQYIVRTYGMLKFKQVFTSGNYTNVYGRTLSTLEANWKTYLSSGSAIGPFAADEGLYLADIAATQNGYRQYFAALDAGKRVQVRCYVALDDARVAADRAQHATVARRMSDFSRCMPR